MALPCLPCRSHFESSQIPTHPSKDLPDFSTYQIWRICRIAIMPPCSLDADRKDCPDEPQSPDITGSPDNTSVAEFLDLESMRMDPSEQVFQKLKIMDNENRFWDLKKNLDIFLYIF